MTALEHGPVPVGAYPQRFREAEARGVRLGVPLRVMGRVKGVDEDLMDRIGRAFGERDEAGARARGRDPDASRPARTGVDGPVPYGARGRHRRRTGCAAGAHLLLRRGRGHAGLGRLGPARRRCPRRSPARPERRRRAHPARADRRLPVRRPARPAGRHRRPGRRQHPSPARRDPEVGRRADPPRLAAAAGSRGSGRTRRRGVAPHSARPGDARAGQRRVRAALGHRTMGSPDQPGRPGVHPVPLRRHPHHRLPGPRRAGHRERVAGAACTCGSTSAG